ncbi:hypothetical protein B0H13DRAFT_2315931 [Mycena leptocephala]|nr:hypothetical protein B0H13DRAFT_2315931 [Mycena leptocephala]
MSANAICMGGTNANDKEEHEIENILSVKKGKHTFCFLVKWKGFGHKYNSWVEEEDAQNAMELIVAFWEKQKKRRKSTRYQDAHVVTPSRRKPIQQKWNEIAHGSGAAGIEFVNQVDDEEVPPGIGTLFCYLERSYILLSSLLSSFWSYSRKISELGIPEPSRLVEYQCSCQTALGAPYTSRGLFTFNTDSEIFECNEVQDNNTSFHRIILRQSSAASVRPRASTAQLNFLGNFPFKFLKPKNVDGA